MSHARWLFSAVLAAGITGGLFYFMQNLIATGDQLAEPVQVARVVDATMPEIEMEVVTEIERPTPIEVIEPPPVEVPMRGGEIDGATYGGLITEVMIGPEVLIPPTVVGTVDGDYVPLVAIAPEYPPTALARGIEGWCTVQFTVDERGNVVEESIVVLEADPPNVFNRTSMRAAARFKFQPRVVDGQGVPVYGVSRRFTYNLDN